MRYSIIQACYTSLAFEKILQVHGGLVPIYPINQSIIDPGVNVTNTEDLNIISGGVPEELGRGGEWTDLTCRWTNCDEGCGNGYMDVPREGGFEGEMMTDHTHCQGHGVSRFCCPSKIEQPKCLWRGHNNDGLCQGQCASWEAAVNSLTFACKEGHGVQMACCTDSVGTRAYKRCNWYGAEPFCTFFGGGHASCSTPYDSKIFAASAGFGGQWPCSTGSRSYCCHSGIPGAFKKCGWYKKETNNIPEDDCEPSCSRTHIRLAIQKGDCKRGEMAYCCLGQHLPSEPVPPPPPPPPPPREPEWKSEYGEFGAALRYYIDNYDTDKCPPEALPYEEDWTLPRNREQAPQYYDPQTGTSGMEILQVADSNSITDSPCYKSWQILLHFLVSAADEKLPQTHIHYLEEKMWDEIVAKGNKDLMYDTLWHWFRWHPFDDPHAVSLTILSNISQWGVRMGESTAMENELCFFPDKKHSYNGPSGVTALSNSDNTTEVVALDRRKIYGVVQDGMRRGAPLMGTILEGIRNLELALHFARWLWYADVRGGHRREGPILELAYWIGPQAGVAPHEYDRTYDRYRDDSRRVNYRSQGPDQWAIFHLHFDYNESMRDGIFFEQNGRTWTGVHSISMFHAHTWIWNQTTGLWSPYTWETRGAGGRNNRDVLDCNILTPAGLDTGRIMPAGPNPWHLNPTNLLTEVARWLSSLYNDGYLSYPSFEYILNQNIFSDRTLEDGRIVRDVNPAVLQHGWVDHWAPENAQVPFRNSPFSRPFIMRRDGDGNLILDHNILPPQTQPPLPGWIYTIPVTSALPTPRPRQAQPSPPGPLGSPGGALPPPPVISPPPTSHEF